MFHDMFGGMWFSWIFWIIIIAVIVWAVIHFTNKPKLSPPNSKLEENPVDILKRRYASGEISKDEFEKMKKDLV
ncbi:MAG: SHOCT domain-containing protein [Ignavibacteriaceae bacterium]|jgi:putative membrane protein